MASFSNAKFVTSAHQPNQFMPDTGIEVAFAGRSNAGKSSAINCITNRKNLARTSKTPGRTQLINFFDVEYGKRLVDLPGYGYAKVSDRMRRHWRDLMATYFGERQALGGLILVMDVRHPLTDFDWQMLDWAEAAERPVHVLLTKADKLKRGPAQSTLLSVKRELGKGASAQLFSATKKTGVDEARAVLADFLNTD